MFDACMHGSSRNKSTSILGTAGVFDALAVRCDGSHTHQPWSASKSATSGWVFDTAGEAEYPSLLSKRLAACIMKHVPAESLNIERNNLRLSSLQVQGRQHKTMSQLIQDFRSYFWAEKSYKPLPNEKLLPPRTAGEEAEVVNRDSTESFAEANQVKVGIFLEPEEHIFRSLQVQHPMDLDAKIPGLAEEGGFQNAHHGAS